MVHGHERLLPGPRERLRKLHANPERGHEPRPRGHGDHVHARAVMCDSQLEKQWEDYVHMLARGHLRHHAAVLGMQRGLRRHQILLNQNAVALATHESYRGFVATRFDAKDTHIAYTLPDLFLPINLFPAGLLSRLAKIRVRIFFLDTFWNMRLHALLRHLNRLVRLLMQPFDASGLVLRL